MNKFNIILVTAPDIKLARNLAKAALETKLAACANIIPHVESHYWWDEKIENESEVLIFFKTSEKNIPELERTICDLHIYDTPEFITLPITSGNHRYLNWLSENIK